MTDGDTIVRELTDHEKARLRQDLEIMKGQCDEFGFLLRFPIKTAYQAAVEPLLFGAGRLHIFTDANLGKDSERVYDFASVFDAVAELCELSLEPDREITGWVRRYVEGQGFDFPPET